MAKRSLLTLKTNVKLQIFFIADNALCTENFKHLKGLQTQEIPLSTYCTLYLCV